MTTRIAQSGDSIRLVGEQYDQDAGKVGTVVYINDPNSSYADVMTASGNTWTIYRDPDMEGENGRWHFVLAEGCAYTNEISSEELATAIGMNFEGKVDAVLADVKASPVNPAHYKGFSRGSEVIDITENLNFNRGSAVKYLARAGVKDASTELEDLHKALWYVTREIARLTLPE